MKIHLNFAPCVNAESRIRLVSMFIDFTNIKEPFAFIKELLPNATEQEIKQAHEQYTEFLNCLWKMHQSQLADKQICDKVEDR